MTNQHPMTKHLCIGIALLSCLFLSSCKEKSPTTMMSRSPVEVNVITTTTAPIEIFSEMSGRTTPYRIAEVRPQVNGIIEKRTFIEGSYVKAGEQLYQIDQSTYKANYDSAKAALARAEASEYSARLTAQRYKTLVKTTAVSELDQVDKEAVWKQTVADVAAAKAALNSATINLDHTKITAPISGVIGKSFITEGALVTAQQPSPLAIIQQLDPIYVDVTQSSLEVLRLKQAFGDTDGAITTDQQDVTILLEDGSAYGQKGKLTFSDVTVDQSTGTVTLRAVVANPEKKLLPGMFVRAKLDQGMQDVILIPSSCIGRTQRGNPYVYVVKNDNTIELRMITTGRTINNDKMVVLSGLSNGEKIVTEGLQSIRPGLQVKAVEAEHVAQQPQKEPQTAAKGE